MVNLIPVWLTSQASWSAVRKQIGSAFQRQISLDARQVEVDGGRVALRSRTIWPDAELAVWSAAGIHHVDNRLDVRYTT
ncbi:hypothetical protein [Deinococcus yunweiensis]|uniref:hypothetical protein n=1 Tax=Deinococcus yunweiensis TaxID=367282 RepID=UPI00398ED7EB